MMRRSQRDGTVASQVLAAAAARPGSVLVGDDHLTLTGAELRSLVTRLAAGLAGLGLHSGDVVAIVPTTSVPAVAVRYAAALVGCATAYCPAGSPAHTASFVRSIGASAVLVLPETASAVELVDSEVPVITYEQVLTGPAAVLPDPPPASDPGWLVSSGGTTGLPTVSRRSFTDWRRMVSAPVDVTRRQLVCTSLVHVGQVLLDQTLVAGGSVVLRDYGTTGEIDAADVLRVIETERVSHLCIVEPQLVQLVDHPDLRHRDLRSCVAINHIGADAAPSLRLRLLRRLESVGLAQVLSHSYGASELGLVSVLQGADYSAQRPGLLGSAGRALPGVDITIERPDGSPAGPDEDGAIIVRSANVAPGVRTSGDVGHLDARGYLHVRGRATDARGSGPCPLFPVDLQDVLCAHPDVRYAVAVPHDDGFTALVVPMPGRRVSSADLVDLLRRQHGRRMPAVEVAVGSRVPLTEQGKPDRVAITTMVPATTTLRLPVS
jgi:fatty-acyl-CoA synthase